MASVLGKLAASLLDRKFGALGNFFTTCDTKAVVLAASPAPISHENTKTFTVALTSPTQNDIFMTAGMTVLLTAPASVPTRGPREPGTYRV